MNELDDNYLKKFYRRNTNLIELTNVKNIIHKSSLQFIKLETNDIFFLWVASNILIFNLLCY